MDQIALQSANKAYIAFGANLSYGRSAPKDTIMASVSQLRLRGIMTCKMSRLWQSPAWPDPDEPPYINAVAQITTTLPPFLLLKTLRTIEQKFGRKRSLRNAPRTLDLDIISFESVCQAAHHLILPHPRLARRAFVLLPLHDVAPLWRLPGSGQSLRSLIEALPERDKAVVLPLRGQ